MMSRSFREADHARRMDTIREDLEKVEKNLEKECSRELSEYLQPLIKFFDRANEYLESRKQSLVRKYVVVKLGHFCPIYKNSLIYL